MFVRIQGKIKFTYSQHPSKFRLIGRNITKYVTSRYFYIAENYNFKVGVSYDCGDDGSES